MSKEGFSLPASVELQHLDLAACKADYRRRRDMAQEHGAIVNAWRVEPPAPAPAAGAGIYAGPYDAGEIKRIRGMLGYEDEPAGEVQHGA